MTSNGAVDDCAVLQLDRDRLVVEFHLGSPSVLFLRRNWRNWPSWQLTRNLRESESVSWRTRTDESHHSPNELHGEKVTEAVQNQGEKAISALGFVPPPRRCRPFPLQQLAQLSSNTTTHDAERMSHRQSLFPSEAPTTYWQNLRACGQALDSTSQSVSPPSPPLPLFPAQIEAELIQLDITTNSSRQLPPRSTKAPTTFPVSSPSSNHIAYIIPTPSPPEPS